MTRVLVFSLLGFLLVTILGALQAVFGMEMVVVDAPLVIVLYLAMSDRPGSQQRSTLHSEGIDWSGGVVGVVLGYIVDVMGGGIKGLHCLVLALMFLVCRRAARQVYLTGVLSSIMVTFSASALSSLMGLAIRWLGGIGPNVGSVTTLLAQAILTAIIAPPLLRLLRIVDRGLSREPLGRGVP